MGPVGAEVVEDLLLGVSLGLGAGLTPGPMTALVLALAAERGLKAGVQAACAPLVTDGPILVLALWALRSVPPEAVAVLAAGGGAYLVTLGLRALRGATHLAEARSPGRLGYLQRAVVANLLNPSPYVFWSTVGSPIVRQAWERSPVAVLAFLLPFFGLLVGCKAALAWAVAVGSRRLGSSGQRKLARASGWLLVASGLAVAGRAIRALM